MPTLPEKKIFPFVYYLPEAINIVSNTLKFAGDSSQQSLYKNEETFNFQLLNNGFSHS